MAKGRDIIDISREYDMPPMPSSFSGSLPTDELRVIFPAPTLVHSTSRKPSFITGAPVSPRDVEDASSISILYVADGVSSKDGKKTVPTARNKQNQSVYVFTADGVYLYNSRKHALELVKKGDFRKLCGKQPFHKIAPLVLVFVSDMKAVGSTPEEQALYAGNHSGSASQNVYLYAASQGLSTVVCGLLDRDAIKKFLNLKADQMVIYSQPVAYPAK